MHIRINNHVYFIKLFFLVFVLFLSVLTFLKPLHAEPEKKLELYYFYSDDCKSCERVSSYLDLLVPNDYKNIEIKKYEVTKNSSNLSLLFYLLEKPEYKTGQKEVDVPVIFVENTVLIGENRIKESLENILDLTFQNNAYSNNAGKIISQYLGEDQVNSIANKQYITIPTIVVSALLDSINPCAIAVMIFLISTLLVSMDKKKILIYGLIYILTIFIIYLGLGLGLTYIIRQISIPHLLFVIVGSILIIMGLLNFKDFFYYGKGISLGIPERLKGTVKNNIQKATIVSIILVGIVISVFESLCSGAIYLGILSLISQIGLNLKLLLFLLLYNFIFILPLLVILLVFYFGLPLKKINRFMIQKNKRVYRLITGIILVLLGVYLIVWF